MNMLAVIDIGNTHAVLGIYHGRRLIKETRVETRRPAARMSRELIRALPRGSYRGVCLSSVVPWADRTIISQLKGELGCGVLVADADSIDVPIVRYIKEEVGADRLVNAYAAYHRYRSSLIIIDFGTATTFDVVTERGEYAGGAIAPGISLANRSLSDYTAKLPRVDIAKTARAIRYSTKTAMQSGVFHGYVGLVNHLVAQMKREMRSKPTVVATGGFARLISPATKAIDAVHPRLTLEGLRLIWENHRKI